MEQRKQKQFLELYEPLHSPFCRYCRAIAGNVTDAEDLVQDTIVCVLGSFDKIKDLAMFKPYLYSVAYKLNVSKHRRKKFRAAFKEDEINSILDPGKDPESSVDFRIIYEKMLSLPEKMANALILYHISDMTLEEIQKIQGGSLSGVKLRLKRGREKLLKSLNTPEQVRTAALFLAL